MKLKHERKAHREGYRRVAGIDEAGRGPLAGPVVASAVILKETRFKQRIDDSKKLTPLARNLAYEEIKRKVWFGIGIVSEKVIDKINIYNATARAMEIAVRNLGVKPDYLLIDGRIRLKVLCKKAHIIGGDSKSLSIACASIIAKVTRDSIMCKYHKRYPAYGFLRHKGYGTREHLRKLIKHGPSPIHRFTFKPVKDQSNK
ncbi:MAG: ribonuclease HII [Candidatus Omnitrophica bacterium]|nr:ribonuclease HII [Candidatus Omnitrophota bacterium]